MRLTTPVIATSIVAILAATLYVTVGRRAPDASTLTQYKLAKAQKGSVRKTVSSTGTLEPWKVVDIKSKAGGKVLKMLVDVGTPVHTNQVIAMIDPSDTQLSYDQAHADTESSKARTTQSEKTFELQITQTEVAIRNANATLRSAVQGRMAAQSRLTTATREANNQPKLTASAIAQAKAAYNQAITARAQVDTTNAQSRTNARSAYDSAVANAKNAQTNLSRQKSLLAKGFVSQQAVDAAQASNDVAQANEESAKTKMDTLEAELRSNVDDANARVAQAKAALNSATVNRDDIQTKRDALRQAKAALEQADAQVEQAQESLRQAKANAVNNDIRNLDITTAKASELRSQATLKNAKDTLDQTTVRSPSEGVVLTKYVDQGTIITSGLSLNSTGSSIVQIGDTTRMYVDVTVDETDIASVDEGQKVDVSFDAYPGVPFDGKVARIDPQAVVTQNVTNIHVRVEIDNSSPTFRLLKPGMNATCDFVVGESQNVLTVPTSAVRTDDAGSYVQIASGGTPAPSETGTNTSTDSSTVIGPKLTRTSVVVGLQGDDVAEITSGLKEGDVIVSQTIEPATSTSTKTTTSAIKSGMPGGGGPPPPGR